MNLTQPTTTSYPVELLAQHFHVAGQFVPLGDPLAFINDAQRGALIIEGATAVPLQPDWRTGEFSRSQLMVPKEQVHIILIGDLDPEEDMRLFPRTENLVVYTDTYAINGYFHSGSDVPVSDIFYSTGGPFFPASNAEACSIEPLTNAIGGAAPVMFVNRDHVKLYYQKE